MPASRKTHFCRKAQNDPGRYNLRKVSHILKSGDNMKKHKWKTYAFWILLAEAVGALSGWVTRDGTEAYNTSVLQPSFSPPSIVFPIVWAILFALMGIGASRIWLAPPSAARTQSTVLFLLQLAVNFFWSIIFFNMQAFGFAFVWLILLWILILWMIISFYKVDRAAAYLQIPYLLWVTFAAILNYAVWQLN